jgi:hypothetical protein
LTRSDYLTFGGTTEVVNSLATLEFLRGAGFGGGALEQAREGVIAAERTPFVFEAIGANYCDFCFARLMGGEYDRLEDGRERCVRCSRTVVRTKEQFADLFSTTRQLVELAFEVRIDVAMEVHMVNAREISRRTGESFQATPGVDARVVGFASRSDAGYALNIENGSPALVSITTIAHELTHIWQFSNWPAGMLATRYGEKHSLTITEGMATWAQIQYLLSIKEFEYAERQEAYTEQRTDDYGIGFRLFRDRYPLSRTGILGIESPFQKEHPL